MKRPHRKRVKRHQKSAPPQGVDLAAVADEVRYVGSPEHKRRRLLPDILLQDQMLPFAIPPWQISERWFSRGFVTQCDEEIAAAFGKGDFLVTFGERLIRKPTKLGSSTGRRENIKATQ